MVRAEAKARSTTAAAGVLLAGGGWQGGSWTSLVCRGCCCAGVQRCRASGREAVGQGTVGWGDVMRNPYSVAGCWGDPANLGPGAVGVPWPSNICCRCRNLQPQPGCQVVPVSNGCCRRRPATTTRCRSTLHLSSRPCCVGQGPSHLTDLDQLQDPSASDQPRNCRPTGPLPLFLGPHRAPAVPLSPASGTTTTTMTCDRPSSPCTCPFPATIAPDPPPSWGASWSSPPCRSPASVHLAQPEHLANCYAVPCAMLCSGRA